MKKEDSIETRVELSLLYDFYGALLKENQKRMFEASILEDYNYAEIAEQEGISRQGVYDAIKRISKQLYEYEHKLGLVSKFQKQKKLIQQLHYKLTKISGQKQDEDWKDIYKLLSYILEEEMME